jgi:L-ribulokinase
MEAGQSAFGDVYAWFKEILSWPLKHILKNASFPNGLIDDTINKIIPELNKRASQLELKPDNELSMDWFNGRRTPDANAFVKGAITGLDLGSDAPGIFYSLAEATCFGSRAIVERFIEQGVPVKGLIGIGGIARKSPFIMQMMADVVNMPIRINRSEQTCALGAAMFAATVAGIYGNVEDAMAAMGQGFDIEYQPDPGKASIYEERYKKYKKMGALMEEF